MKTYQKVMLAAFATPSVRIPKLASMGALIGLIALGFAPIAEANPITIGDLTVTAMVGGGALPGSTVDNLNNLKLGKSGGTTATGVRVSFGGTGEAVQGSDGDVYAAPYLSGNNGTRFGSGIHQPNEPNGIDTSTYISAGGTTGSYALLELPSNYYDVGLLWGSIDTYNTLELLDIDYGKNGKIESETVVGTVTGSEAAESAGISASGNQGIDGTAYVNITSSTAFNAIEGLSSQYAFEIDNLSYSNDPPVRVPEPPSLAMLLMGLGLVAGAVYFGRKRAFLRA